MKKLDIIEEIIFLPLRSYERNVSIYSLLKESDYFELHNQINESDIFKALTQHVECVDQWLHLSENKRSSSGWYIKQTNSENYIVGYYPSHEINKTIDFSDKLEACAHFIKRELEDLRNAR